jgi:hypothetical protein
MTLFEGVGKITLVDIADPDTPLLDHFARTFDIEFVKADAHDFLRDGRSKFDFAYVDLYSEHSHCPLVQMRSFHEALRCRLSPDGVAAFNCFDIGSYALPEVCETISTATMSVLCGVFDDVRFLKHRRNVLAVVWAGTMPKRTIRINQAHSPTDRLAARIAEARAQQWLRFASPRDHSAFLGCHVDPREFTTIQLQFEARARLLYKRLSARYPVLRRGSTFRHFSLECAIDSEFLAAVQGSRVLADAVLTELAAASFEQADVVRGRLDAVLSALRLRDSDPLNQDALSSLQTLAVRLPDRLSTFDSLVSGALP